MGFERLNVVIRLIQFGVPLLILLPGVINFLDLCRFRLDRLDASLLKLGQNIVDRKFTISRICATLFLGEGASTRNIEFRHNFFWAARCMLCLLTLPWFLFLTGGFATTLTVKPTVLGICTLFVGTTIQAIRYSLYLWRLEKWRLTRASVGILSFSLMCIVTFPVIIIMLGPKINHEKTQHRVDFVSLMTTILTMGLIPRALEAVEFDSGVRRDKEKLALSLSAAATIITRESMDEPQEGYWLMKECYTASSGYSQFDFVPDIAGNLCGFSNHVNSTEMATIRQALLCMTSRSTFLMLILGAFAYTTSGYVALFVSIFLYFTDTIHSWLGVGHEFWSPTRTIFLMIIARALIIMFGSSLWIIGLSTAYCVYGVSLACDIVNKFLPCLDPFKVRSILFLMRGRKNTASRSADIICTPEFAFGTLTAMFFVIVLIAGFAQPPGLRLPKVELSTQAMIPVSICPVLAWLGVMFAGAAFGSVRAAYLDSEKLLVGSTATIYLVSPSFNLTKMLATLAYISLLMFGFLLWGASQSPQVFVFCAFGPPYILCLFHTIYAWLSNDCQLVVWPPAQLPTTDDSAESELVFDVLQVMMGPDLTNSRNVLHAPSLVHDSHEDVASVEVPMLPPKSKTKTSISSTSRKLPAFAQRHQVMDLGLHACRVHKANQSADDHGRKRRGLKSAVSLTLKEVCIHFTLLVWKKLVHECTEPTSKVTDEECIRKLDMEFTPEIPLWEAMLTGCLLAGEYLVIISAALIPFLGLMLGGVLARLSHSQTYTSHLSWIAILCFLLTMYPIVKWFKHYKITHEMLCACILGSCLLVGILGWVIQAWLDTQISIVRTLSLVNALVLYLVFLFKLSSFLAWVDRGGTGPVPSKSESTEAEPIASSGIRIATRTTAHFARMAKRLIICFVLAQVYLLGSPSAGFILFFSLIFGGSTLLFVTTLANHDFHLSPKILHAVDAVILGSSIVLTAVFLVTTGASSRMAISLVFVLHLCKCAMKVIQLAIHLDMDTLFWCSPTLLPVYSYSIQTAQIADQTQLAVCCFVFIGIGVLWAACLVCFERPVTLGIGLFSAFVWLALAVLTLICVQIPQKLNIAASYLSPRVFANAATMALRTLEDASHGRSKFEVRCDEWNPSDSHGDRRGLELSALKIAAEIEVAEKSLRLIPVDGIKAVWRADALYTDLDGVAETCASHGPFACLGSLMRFFQMDCACLRDFDAQGQRALVQELFGFEPIQAVLHLLDLEDSFRYRFEDECYALTCFHFCVFAATETCLTQEQTYFQHFLQENRLKLLSSGLSLPLTSNMRCVASWVQALHHDQREQFYLLQDNYKMKQTDQEQKIDEHDSSEVMAATDLAQKRFWREQDMRLRHASEALLRRSKRIHVWAAALNSEDRHHFNSKLKQQWENNVNCYVHPRDERLRQSYRLHVLLDNDEIVGNCRERLAELEAGELDCYPSKAREGALQFVDPEFQPGPMALGSCIGTDFVSAWNHALSVNPHAVLFTENWEPEDIHPGACVDDSWLLAALWILSATCGTSDGDVSLCVKDFFINTIDLEGNVVYDSAVGAFGLKLFVSGRWEALVVDDALPMLGDGSSRSGVHALVALDALRRENDATVTRRTNNQNWPEFDSSASFDSSLVEAYSQRYKDCAGFAVAHSTEMAELWISLLEKGVAKYYGSYGDIEAGFVHQGLELLTGHHAECIHIARASRGVRKSSLWGTLLRSHNYGFILSARAVLAEHAPLSLQGSGLSFGATYIIHKVIDVMPERHQLIRLRNPVGHRDAFRGVWSHSSSTWTKRLRHKLPHSENHTFWVSFNEFCFIFRCLFVCKYFAETSAQWKQHFITGQWNCAQLDCQENTAAGLPSSHNPGCEVGRNPQYSIILHRPTTLHISIVQSEAQHVIWKPLPIAGYICRGTLREGEHVDRITKLGFRNIVSSTGKARRKRAIEVFIDRLNPGAYVLLVGTFQAEMEGQFTVKAMSSHEILVRQIWPPTWRSDENVDRRTGALVTTFAP